MNKSANNPHYFHNQMAHLRHRYYKYRALYSNRTLHTPDQFTQSIIKSRKLFYSAPASFNDPFDCNLQLHTDNSTDDEWICYIDTLIRKHPHLKEQLTTFKTNKMWRTNQDVQKFGTDARKEIYEDSSVLCLSNRPNSIPMFAYYADGHHGIVLEFEFSDTDVPCGVQCVNPLNPTHPYDGSIVMADVVYSAKLPELNYHRLYGSEQLIKSLMFTKFKEWEHEKEFRVFRRGIAASAVEYPSNMLKKVIFGARTNNNDVALVKDWLTTHEHPVVLAKAFLSKDQFRLDINEIEIYQP